jgi:hypothetical protein
MLETVQQEYFRYIVVINKRFACFSTVYFKKISEKRVLFLVKYKIFCVGVTWDQAAFSLLISHSVPAVICSHGT